MPSPARLGLEPALERRHARLSDISVNNVLWVNNQAQAKMKGGLTDLLMEAAKAPAVQLDKAQDITIDEFVATVLPKAKSMELLIQGAQQTNFMSLTAPVHDDVPQLFKWPNNFAWSYDGNMADSNIKEKVKAAGGNVTNAALRVSLAWFNYDDLDLHAIVQGLGVSEHIYFASKRGRYGCLDVDMNAGGGTSRTPVENISWTQLPNGRYDIVVDQYRQRETTNVGCTVEIECGGKITQLSYPGVLRPNMPFCSIHIKDGKIEDLSIAPDITATGISQDKWGVKTETFTPVSLLMHSPNHWDGLTIGNKHWFFILDKCKNPDPVRGIYNEFLIGELDKHRKVFEILGDKTQCPPADEQLSGMGFSSTRNDTVAVRVVSDKATRLFNIIF